MMNKRNYVGVFLAVFFWASSAVGFTDYSGDLDFDTIRERYRSGQMSREDYLVSSLKAAFKPGDTPSGTKSATVHKGRRDLTMLFKNVVLYYDEFSPEAREIVDNILKRPDSSANNWPWDTSTDFYLTNPIVYEPTAVDYPHIGGKYKFWYQVGADPDPQGHNTTESFMRKVVDEFEVVYAKEISDMGYSAPPFDSGGADEGGDTKIDVYLMNCGFDGVYGYTAPEDVGDNYSYAAYMVVDNDFDEFGVSSSEEEDAMKVTVAHEFHHAIQFGINITIQDNDEWIMEATSAWIESQVYPDIRDNLQYLNGSKGYFAMPEIPLDSEDQLYNAWIFFQYMTVLWGTPDVVLDLWETHLNPQRDENGNVISTETIRAMTGIENTISGYRSDLETVFTDFALKNYTQSDFYPYPDYVYYDDVAMDNGSGQTLDFSTDQSHYFDKPNISLQHLAARYYKFKPGLYDGEAGDTLLIQVGMTSGTSVSATVVLKNMNNSFTSSQIPLNASNQGDITIENFNLSSFKEAVLVLVNYESTPSSTARIYGGLDVEPLDDLKSVDGTYIPLETEDEGGGCFITGTMPY